MTASPGWRSAQFRVRTRFEATTLSMHGPSPEERERMDYWEQSGAFQAMAQNVVAASLSGIDHIVVRFEDVCRDPLTQFQRIFDYCELGLGARLRGEIERSSQVRDAYAPGRYDTVRDSVDVVDRWRRQMKPDAIDAVRRGYFACRPRFYDEPADW